MSETPTMQKIIWLASYPKSGNTWLRAFLANLKSEANVPADINDLRGGPIASARFLFDEAMGIEASDLTLAEIERYRPAVYEHMATFSETTLFLKIHDAFTWNDAGIPVVSRTATQGAIYLIRNPLDVAVSYAHHMNAPIDRAINVMAQEKHALVPSKTNISNQLRQRLLTWSRHVKSWVDDSELSVHMMRYEDMVQHPVETFTAAARFADLSTEPGAIERAIAFSSFDVLQSQEREHGFSEKPSGAESFFRKGKVGAWREVLSDQQVDQIVQDHRQVMSRFGYLTDSGMPVY